MAGYTIYKIIKDDKLSEIVKKFKSGALFPDNYFEVDEKLTWQMVWKDPKNSEQGCICSATNLKKTGKTESHGWVYIGEVVYLPYLSKEISIDLIHGKPIDIFALTGDIYKVKPFMFLPFIDAHMHIQTFNAAPLTLQWTKLYLNSLGDNEEEVFLKTQKRMGQTRREINDFVTGWLATSLAMKDFGKVGRLSTDLIARLYMGQASDAEMKESLFWLLWSDEEIAKYQAESEKKREEKKQEIAREMEISSLTQARVTDFMDFYREAAYYFHKKQVFHISYVMPMDMSYAHFWGQHGFPVYIPHGNDQLYYINDFISLSRKSEIKQAILSEEVSVNVETYRPGYELQTKGNIRNLTQHLFYDYELEADFTSFKKYLHYLALGEKIPERHFYLFFDEPAHLAQGIMKKAESNRKKKAAADSREAEQFKKELAQWESSYQPHMSKTKSNKTRHWHFLTTVPDYDNEKFEDHWLQTEYTLASGVRYPLQLLLFYHYDPRRYYENEDQLNTLIDKMLDEHAFFTYQKTNGDFTYKSSDDRVKGEFLSLQPFKFGKNDCKRICTGISSSRLSANSNLKRAPGNMTSFEEIKKTLFPAGLFVGIKMYPALGYPPHIFDKGQFDNQFNHLKLLYRHCIDNDLPIMAHCSPLGMTIADGHNYWHAAEGSREDFPARQSALYIDRTYAAPVQWQQVLDFKTGEFNKLKICLAHFGGKGIWAQALGQNANNEFDWRNSIINLIDKYPNVYTDISCFTLNNNSPLPEKLSAEDMEDLLTGQESSGQAVLRRCYRADRGLFGGTYFRLNKPITQPDESLLRHILRAGEILDDSVETIGQHLVEALNKSEKLKSRLLMGSDWLMSELDLKGVGAYYGGMFDLLRYISTKLGEKYDAWHQFAVINPLNYLGLLKKDQSGEPITEDYNGKSVYVLNKERLNTYKDTFLKFIETKNWLERADIAPDELDNAKEDILSRMKQLKYSKLFKAEDMRNNMKKLLLTSVNF